MRMIFKTIACLVLLIIVTTAPIAAAKDKLEGVWKCTEFSFSGPNARTFANPPSLYIFAKGHFSTMAVLSEKPRPDLPAQNATDAQRVAAWSPFMASVGTYEIKGTTLTTKNLVSKSPNDMAPGAFFTSDFKIEGNTLSLTMKANQTGPMANPVRIKLVRVQ
jgi:hypothetical protein